MVILFTDHFHDDLNSFERNDFVVDYNTDESGLASLATDGQVSASRIAGAPQGPRGSCSTGRAFAAVLGSILHNSVLSQEGPNSLVGKLKFDGLHVFFGEMVQD